MAITKKDFLKFAFEEAVKAAPTDSFRSEIAEQVLATGMRAYSDREGHDFTDEEIKETIKKGLEEIRKASSDFMLQDWSMRR